MKRLTAIISLAVLVGTVVLTGCKKEEPAPVVPETPPSTNDVPAAQ